MSLLRVREIFKEYGDTPVLNGLSLQVREGQVVVLIGSSGSGKSTLLRCINGLESFSSGSVSLSGSQIPTKPSGLREWRENIGFVFQSFNLFPHLTAADNIALPLRLVKGESKASARVKSLEALSRVGLAAQADSYSTEISGGQAQRVAIARALAIKPKVMLFDEPTSALDPELTGEVIDVMADLARDGMTMLVVSHELRFVRKVADFVYFLVDGTIHESGKPESIFSNPQTPECRRFIHSIVD